MTFEEILDQALDMLRRRGRVTYGVLKRQFALDEAYVAGLKDALLYTTKRSCITSRANCCSYAQPRTTQLRVVGISTKPRRAFITPATWPVNSKQNPSNCAPP